MQDLILRRKTHMGKEQLGIEMTGDYAPFVPKAQQVADLIRRRVIEKERDLAHRDGELRGDGHRGEHIIYTGEVHVGDVHDITGLYGLDI